MKIQELLIKLFKKSINNKIRKVTVVQVADNVEDTERTNNNMIDILLINNTVTDIQLFFKVSVNSNRGNNTVILCTESRHKMVKERHKF